ncbi:hypothetical protein [Roseibium sp. MMSF_3412]|uniref:hypothetical protein n=1 Tax=Roseibium sp. MMSF_3412 TaxID=3046712 RepID=UPI00273FE72D|nr:hypothetical protein [Roseibium sp. MMSF_3412]
MHQERNLFAESFSSLYALRWLVLAHVIVNCILTVVDTWLEDTWYFVYLYAPFGAIFCFFMLCRILKAQKPQRNLKQFITFSIWYLLVFFVLALGGAELVTYLFETASDATKEQDSFVAGYVLFTLVCLFVPAYLLGTILPAKLLQKSDSIRAALKRALRQAGYLLPRYGGIYVPFSLVSAILYLALQAGGPELQPVTSTGEVHAFSFLLMVISTLISIAGEAMLMVTIARAYLKDLRELGDTSQFDVEVFA